MKLMKQHLLSCMVLLLSLAPLSTMAEFVATFEIDEPTLNVRSGPSVGANKLFEIQQNTSVEVIGRSGNWRRIRLSDGVTGWVNGRYLSDNTVPYFDYFRPTHRIIRTKTGYMNIRSGPGTSNLVVTRAFLNDDVMHLGGRSGRWYEIMLPDGTEAWVHAVGIRPLTDRDPIPPTQGEGETFDNQLILDDFPEEVVSQVVNAPAPPLGSFIGLEGTVLSPELARYCNYRDSVGEIICGDATLAELDLLIGIEALKLGRTLTRDDFIYLSEQQQRFRIALAEDCFVPPSTVSLSQRVMSRLAGCLGELHNLRLWQLKNRYLSVDVTPDVARPEDRAAYPQAMLR